MWASAMVSRWAVETPGRNSALIKSRTSPTRRPARRIFSISARDLRVTTSGSPDGIVGESGEKIVRDRVDRADALDGPQRAGPPIVLDHLREGVELDGEPGPDRVRLVVDPLDQLRAVDVAAARLHRRVRVLVVDMARGGADPATGQPEDQLVERNLDVRRAVDPAA